MPCTFGLSPSWFWPLRLSSSSSEVGVVFRPPSRGLLLGVWFPWPGGSLSLGGWGLCSVFTLIRHPCFSLQCWMNFLLLPKVLPHPLQALFVLSFISLLSTCFRFFASSFLCISLPTSSGLGELCAPEGFLSLSKCSLIGPSSCSSSFCSSPRPSVSLSSSFSGFSQRIFEPWFLGYGYCCPRS